MLYDIGYTSGTTVLWCSNTLKTSSFETKFTTLEPMPNAVIIHFGNMFFWNQIYNSGTSA